MTNERSEISPAGAADLHTRKKSRGEPTLIVGFHVKNHKVIREVYCDKVPPLMVICGPNGVGKTTLLDAIGRRMGIRESQPTKVCVAPATRTWRKEDVQSRMLYANPIGCTDVYDLSSPVGNLASRFGRSYYTSNRDLWSDDEAKQLVKPLLAKLKTRWRESVARQIEEAGCRTPERNWPNPRIPLEEFTRQVFDKLEYIDTQDDQETTLIKFSSTDLSHQRPFLDIDDLSSGEKAIFSILLPVIEEDFRRQLGESARDVTVVIDEVENHLHPSLQSRVLEYMRMKARDGFQFICTTHSTTLIKECRPDELFHILPRGLTTGNQLRPAAQEVESLVEVMHDRVLLANGYRRHLFCEGFVLTKRDENHICDSELYSVLLDTTEREKVCAAGSSGEVRKAARAACATTLFGPLCLVTVTDKDEENATDPSVPWCDIVLPVYSLESVLLDTDAIADVLDRYEVTVEQIKGAVDRALDRVISEREVQLLKPDACLKRKADISLDQGLLALRQNDIASAFEVQQDAVKRIEDARKRTEDARKNHEVALGALKGKKVYNHLFEALNLRGLGFTPRSFAVEVVKRVRARAALKWLGDFELVAKRAVGNALSRLLFSPVGDPLRQVPQHAAIVDRVLSMVEPVDFAGFTYAVLRKKDASGNDIRLDEFAAVLASLATVVREAMPDYKWSE